MLLMRPDAETNNAFIYCLAVAAQLANVAVLFTCAMSNHHHTIVYDRDGTYPIFLEHFHKLFAKCQNSLRGRWENFWSSEKTSVVRLIEPDDIISKIVYAAANPVKDHLVERALDWPGVSALGSFVSGKALRATRPSFFRVNGKMPESVELQLELPPELGLGTREEVVAKVLANVRQAEDEAAQERTTSRRAALGRDACGKQRWNSRPASIEPRRNMNPTVAARSKWARIEALMCNRDFVNAYRRARLAWIAGLEAIFPVGTYWLQRFASVPIATPAA